MDPEQIYQEVLSEEQGKGVSGAVAEGRAKAARVRAEHGSPHPKEAKWWPGAQPHFEGDGAAPEAAEEAPAEEEAVEEAAAEAPAPEPEPEPEPAPAPAEAPAAAEVAAPQPEPEPAQPTAQPAAVVEPSGVTHGTPTGTRLRPEDAVATQSQFDAQQAVYERRKLIDDLVTTGAPAITAQEAGKPRAPFLALLYILIPLIAIIVVVSQDEESSSEPAGGEATAEQTEGGEGGGGGGVTIVAQDIAFDPTEFSIPAGEEATVTLDNQDSGIDHNISIYASQEDGISKSNPLFEGDIFAGVDSMDYQVGPLDAGDYYFQCDVHPNMNGTVSAE